MICKLIGCKLFDNNNYFIAVLFIEVAILALSLLLLNYVSWSIWRNLLWIAGRPPQKDWKPQIDAQRKPLLYIRILPYWYIFYLVKSELIGGSINAANHFKNIQIIYIIISEKKKIETFFHND